MVTSKGFARMRKKHAKAYRPNKEVKNPETQLTRTRQERDVLLALARTRELTDSEGAKLSMLCTRVRRLEKKVLKHKGKCPTGQDSQ